MSDDPSTNNRFDEAALVASAALGESFYLCVKGQPPKLIRSDLIIMGCNVGKTQATESLIRELPMDALFAASLGLTPAPPREDTLVEIIHEVAFPK